MPNDPQITPKSGIDSHCRCIYASTTRRPSLSRPRSPRWVERTSRAAHEGPSASNRTLLHSLQLLRRRTAHLRRGTPAQASMRDSRRATRSPPLAGPTHHPCSLSRREVRGVEVGIVAPATHRPPKMALLRPASQLLLHDCGRTFRTHTHTRAAAVITISAACSSAAAPVKHSSRNASTDFDSWSS